MVRISFKNNFGLFNSTKNEEFLSLKTKPMRINELISRDLQEASTHKSLSSFYSEKSSKGFLNSPKDLKNPFLSESSNFSSYFSWTNSVSRNNFLSKSISKESVILKCQSDSKRKLSCFKSISSKSINKISCITLNPKQEVLDVTNNKKLIPKKFKQNVLFENSEYWTGKLKFYNRKKGYGFITLNNTDVFLHKDDLAKANITMENVKFKSKKNISLKFRLIEYKGKNKISRKAIDITILSDGQIAK